MERPERPSRPEKGMRNETRSNSNPYRERLWLVSSDSDSDDMEMDLSMPLRVRKICLHNNPNSSRSSAGNDFAAAATANPMLGSESGPSTSSPSFILPEESFPRTSQIGDLNPIILNGDVTCRRDFDSRLRGIPRKRSLGIFSTSTGTNPMDFRSGSRDTERDGLAHGSTTDTKRFCAGPSTSASSSSLAPGGPTLKPRVTRDLLKPTVPADVEPPTLPTLVDVRDPLLLAPKTDRRRTVTWASSPTYLRFSEDDSSSLRSADRRELEIEEDASSTIANFNYRPMEQQYPIIVPPTPERGLDVVEPRTPFDEFSFEDVDNGTSAGPGTVRFDPHPSIIHEVSSAITNASSPRNEESVADSRHHSRIPSSAFTFNRRMIGFHLNSASSAIQAMQDSVTDPRLSSDILRAVNEIRLTTPLRLLHQNDEVWSPSEEHSPFVSVNRRRFDLTGDSDDSNEAEEDNAPENERTTSHEPEVDEDTEEIPEQNEAANATEPAPTENTMELERTCPDVIILPTPTPTSQGCSENAASNGAPSSPVQEPPRSVESSDNSTNTANMASALQVAPLDGMDFNSKLVSLLECPVCMDVIIPPIRQCKKGHPVCSVCRPKLVVCPTCRARFTETRNLLMEKVAELMLFPCKNSTMCPVSVSLKDKAAHELSCGFRQYGCIEKTCDWKGFKQELVEHAYAVHPGKIIFGNQQKIVIPCQTNLQSMWVWSVMEEVFLVSFKYMEHNILRGIVVYLGPPEDAKKYLYKFQIYGRNKMYIKYKELTFSDDRNIHCPRLFVNGFAYRFDQTHLQMRYGCFTIDNHVSLLRVKPPKAPAQA